MSYTKPILIEIYSEIFLEPATLSTERCFEIVPKLKALGLDKIEMGEIATVNIDLQKGVVAKAAVPRIRCWSSDRRRLVQLSQDQIVVNDLNGYQGWETYREIFDNTLQLINAGANPLRCRSLALHTIDRFSVPLAGFTLGRYFNCDGTMLPTWYNDCATACDIVMGQGMLDRDSRNRVIKISAIADAGNMVVNWTSAFHNLLKPGDNVQMLLESLHDESNVSFEAFITNVTRNEVMGGGGQ